MEVVRLRVARQPFHADGVFLNGHGDDDMDVEGVGSSSVDLHTLEESVRRLKQTLEMLPDGYNLKREVTPLYQQLIEKYENHMKIYKPYRTHNHSREDDKRDLYKRKNTHAWDERGKRVKPSPIEASIW